MVYRSILFVPGMEKTLVKIGKLAADAYIIDLEDSIAQPKKEEALQKTIAYLRANLGCENIYVRINAENHEKELHALHEIAGVGFMLPKYENNAFYADCRDILLKHPVIALIEHPKGLIHVESIASCEWVNALAFGAEDYSAATNIKKDFTHMYYHKSKLVEYAKAYDRQVYDTPSFCIDAEEKIETDVQEAIDLGFDGKLAIHPRQVEIINKKFKACDIQSMQRIVNQYEKSKEAVLMIDGKIYEKMHIEQMKRMIEMGGC